MFKVSYTGTYSKTIKFLKDMEKGSIFNRLDSYGRKGVDLLASASPIDTGLMAQSWGYQIGHKDGIYSLSWFNTNVENGVNVAIIVQYGHGTGTGGFVQGRDYINPAVQPLFDKMVEDIWREVRRA